MLDAHQLLWTQIAAGVCTLIFAGLLFNMFRMRSRMQAAGNWDRVEGVITVSKVDQPPTHVSDDLNDATPIIHYRYRVGGQDIPLRRGRPKFGDDGRGWGRSVATSFAPHSVRSWWCSSA